MSAPSMPSSTQGRNGNSEGSRSNRMPSCRARGRGAEARRGKRGKVTVTSTPAPAAKQHKYQQKYRPPSQQQATSAATTTTRYEDLRQSGSLFPPKRHANAALTSTSLSPPRPIQTSPSLGMSASPTNQEVHGSVVVGSGCKPELAGAA